MLFSEKLVFLLNLTGTSNKQLAVALSVDPSLISRMRQGRRNPPQNSEHISCMSAYFAKKCTTDYQRSALAETIGQNRIKLIMKNEALASIIKDWLADDKPVTIQHMESIIQDIIMPANDFSTSPQVKSSSLDVAQSRVYYGNAGKRSAFHAFTTYLIQIGKPCEVYITTDESLEWISEDRDFAAELYENLMKLATQGFTFIRITPKHSNIEDAIDAFTRWLPIYKSGNLKTYYYPRIRDNLFHRTLFVAPRIISISSMSVGYHVDSDMTFLNIGSDISNAYVRQFNDYLNKCLPMTLSHTHNDGGETICECIQRHVTMAGSKYEKYYGLPSLITPQSVLKRMLRYDKEKIDILLACEETYNEMLSHKTATAVIRLANPQDVYSGKVFCPVSVLLPDNKPCYYKPYEYVAHLKGLLQFMEKHIDYTVIALDSSMTETTIFSSDGGYCFILGGKDPFTLLEISDHNVISAATEYILNFANPNAGTKAQERKRTIEQIQNLIYVLEKGQPSLQQQRTFT